MPTDITPFSVGVWFAVGFFTGLGWTLAVMILSRIVR